jgi:glycosyltransferase involved in cell wall biosynthesis
MHESKLPEMLPKISIVMPVLNSCDTIEKAIRSIVDQHYANIELIIIDGGSTDTTLTIIKRYESYIAYWHSKADGSSSVAANLGIEKATGDLVVLLMADDWYEPGILHKISQALIANPDADMVTCGGRIVFYDEKTQHLKTKWTYATSRRMELTLQNICFDITSAICCRFIRKSLFDRIGLFIPFDSNGKHMLSNDKEFLMRAIIHNAKNVFVAQIGHNYLAHPGSATFGNHKKNILRMCYEHMETIERHLQKYELSRKHKVILMYWYNDQSARLLLYKLLDRDIRGAYAVAKDGVGKYKWFWPVAFVSTFVRIVVKRAFRLIHLIH